jgi:hypothetical protein
VAVDPKAPAVPPAAAAAPAETKPEREIPSFSAVVADRTAARSAEIATSAGAEPPAAVPAKPAGEPATPAELSDEDFVKQWDALPESLRAGATKRHYQQYNNAIAGEYGDILPTIVAARENPKLREVLVELGDSTKGELLDLISDPALRKEAKKLTTPEIREFLLGEALQTYEKYAVPPGTRRDPEAPTPEQARITQLEERFDTEAIGRENTSYIQSRGQEVAAVRSAFGQLTPDQIAHVVTFTENRFETMAARSGIDTNKDGWAARAVRAGLKPPQYREYAAQYAEVIGRSAPPAAPAGNAAPGAAGAAAPRDAAEAKRSAGVTALSEFKKKSPAFTRPATRR